MNYILHVSKDGDSLGLFSKEGLTVSKGYERIVIGGRGPYVEFTEDQIVFDSFKVPREQLYRFKDARVYYIELRSVGLSNIKLYFQLKTVSYADYKIGMFYISPYELYDSTGRCIVSDKTTKNNEFFN
jgi:hypothetical protein